MTTSTVCILIAIIAYMAIIVAVGVYFSRKNKNADDFYLGGRKLGPIVSAMSAEASDMSSWLLMGLPGVAYVTGVADAGWTAIGLAIGTYLNWLIVAKRLRRYTIKTNSITIPEFFKNRYRDQSPALVGISALVILIFFIPYTASGFAACGKLFSTLFGIDYMTAMIVSAIVIVFYTMLGGFLAASTTDLIQSIVMTIALVVIVGYGVSQAGGFAAVADNASQVKGYISLVNSGDITNTSVSTPYGLLTIVSVLAWGLGYFGMPHILLRFMAIRKESEIKISRRIAIIWVTISMAVAIFIGIVGYAAAKNGVIAMATTSAEGEKTVINLAMVLSKEGIGFALVAGVILAGILACTMSTSDSQLLAASSSFSQNILIDVFKCKLSDKAQLVLARITVIVIAIIGVFLAKDPDSSVFQIVSFAWAGFGATFGPLMLFSLFWKRTNKVGALAGLISGGIMVFVWKFVVRPMGGVLDIYELLPAFIVSSICIVVFSLLTKAPSEEIVEEFEQVASQEIEQA